MQIEKLRGKMAERKVSQKELAAILDVSQNTVCRKLSQKGSFTIPEAKQICDYLGIDEAGEREYIFLR